MAKYKYLVIRFSSIGDIVLTSPVLRMLKKRRPDAHIHFVTKKKYAPLVAHNPYVHKVHVLDDSFPALIRELRAESFDYVLDLHRNLRSFVVKNVLGEKSFTFNKLNWSKWLLVNFKINILPPIHIVDRYLETLRELRVKKDAKGLDFFIPKDVVLPSSVEKVAVKDGFVALAAGAQHATKKIPMLRMAELCGMIALPVVLVGGEEEHEQGNEIARICPNVHNACGTLNIYQSAIVIERAKVVVAHDTGLMHIAAAFKKDIVSVWGNTVPEFGMYPYLPGEKSKIFEVKDLRCRPCSKIGFDECPKGHFRCMNDIDYKQVADYVNKLAAIGGKEDKV
ncbi:MAG: glycosyltransferase family 9 protein [Prevotellaceae bacterium]|jgi:heptosyltransferase-2|nr:glycosyltransferase family 9 protein [Prevotellaceae bacterium]